MIGYRPADYWISEHLETSSGYDIWEMMDMIETALNDLPGWPQFYPSGVKWQAWLKTRPENHVVNHD